MRSGVARTGSPPPREEGPAEAGEPGAPPAPDRAAGEEGAGAPAGEAGSHRAGFCAIAGLANVGKSTLLNRLVGEKLAIVTPKAQTTRRRLLGIYSDDRHQAVFVDTPGLLEPRYPLQESMRAEAEDAIEGAELLLYVVDGGYAESVEAALTSPLRGREGAILCLNKVDRVREERREELEGRLREAGWDPVVATVASEGRGVERLRAAVLERLPASPPLYPPDQLSDAPVRDFVAEFVRETCFEELEEEVPYSVAVEVERFREDEPLYISAVLHVERSSQKGIVIGKDGRMIRKIGSRARSKIESFLGRHVYLDLRVKVLAKWRKRRDRLARLGYRLPADAE